jgi:hypothetical protein
VHIEKVEPRRGAPVAQQARLHVVERQRPLQQGIVFQVDLADGKIVGGAPVGVHFGQQFRAHLPMDQVVKAVEARSKGGKIGMTSSQAAFCGPFGNHRRGCCA